MDLNELKVYSEQWWQAMEATLTFLPETHRRAMLNKIVYVAVKV